MFNFRQGFFHRVTDSTPVPSLCLDVETAIPVKTKQSNHHIFSVLDSGEVTIAHKSAQDRIQLTAQEARSLRNLLNGHSTRDAIGTPYKPTPPMSEEKRARKAEAARPALLVYYEDVASIDPGFAVPTDADLKEVFEQHYRGDRSA